jgi:S-adenosylmethionine-diacylglycerol 3-amino-3-carboxypropyl transferase
MGAAATVRDRIRNGVFRAVHRHNLVYNACWEDPALDRVALGLGPADRVAVITSAGCNALDYLLAGAGEVHAVDVNPIQNALLELKAAGLRALDHASFFALFGRGRSPHARAMYFDALRDRLSPPARRYWDRHIAFFSGRGWRRSFYYQGTAGSLARLLLAKLRAVARLGRPLEDLLRARTLDEQRAVYEAEIRDRLWSPALGWLLRRSATLSLLGVPPAQRRQIEEQCPGGLVGFLRGALEAVATRLPLSDNYFWRVYLQGHYTPDCCPEYLKPANFARLQAGLLDRLHVHTATLTGFLRRAEPGLTKLVLLDHMDWMSHAEPQALAAEWDAILAKARPGARVIFRSAAPRVTYLDHLRVRHRGREAALGHLLRYDRALADRLHERDRVHTYGSFSIADLPD